MEADQAPSLTIACTDPKSPIACYVGTVSDELYRSRAVHVQWALVKMQIMKRRRRIVRPLSTDYFYARSSINA